MLIECYPPEVDFALPVIIGVPVGDGAAVDVALLMIIGVPVGDGAAVDVALPMIIGVPVGDGAAVDVALLMIIGVPVGDGAAVDVALPMIIGVPVGDGAAVDVGSGSVILACWTPSIVPPAVGIATHINNHKYEKVTTRPFGVIYVTPIEIYIQFPPIQSV